MMTSSRSWRRSTVLAGAIMLGVCLATTAWAAPMECPAPQKLARPGVLKETAVQIAELQSFLASGDLGNHVPAIIEDLRQRYPGVENAEIENYLMTAYCPIVARLSGLSDAERQARIDRFTSQVSQMIAATPEPPPIHAAAATNYKR